MKSAYPLPPYARLAKPIVRAQLDVQVRDEHVDLAHEAMQRHGSPATEEPGHGHVRGCFATVPLAAAARDDVLQLDAQAQWALDQTFWFDLEAHYAMFRAFATERFWVGPPWRAHEAPRGKHRIVVGGDELVFGDLGHPTTELALRALERLDLRGRSVLDAGCGTGVLAVAAALLGARPVLGVDLADVGTARALASTQRVKAAFEQRGIELVSGRFDAVVANIHVEPLIGLVPKLFELAKGTVVITGYPDRYRAQVLGERVPARVDNVHGFECAVFTAPTAGAGAPRTMRAPRRPSRTRRARRTRTK